MESTGYEWHQVASSDVNKGLTDRGGHNLGTGWWGEPLRRQAIRAGRGGEFWIARTAIEKFTERIRWCSTPDAEDVYPETADGLKALLAELMAPKAEDVTKSESLYATLTIPEHKQWFEKTFGSEEGARPEAEYS